MGFTLLYIIVSLLNKKVYGKQYLLSEYIRPEEFEAIKKFAQDKETPFLFINLDKVEEKYDELRQCLPFAKIYYAVKANPNNEVLKVLKDKGACFDIATVYELDQILSLGVSPQKLAMAILLKKRKILPMPTIKVFGCLLLIQRAI